MSPSFQSIKERAEARKGGADALKNQLKDYSALNVTKLTDDRILSEFSKRIFQAGFNWSVVENKWPGFETAFHKFDIGHNALMSDDEFDAHMKNPDIIRHAKKILSVRDNAVFLAELAQEHGSAAQFFHDWPVEDLIGLWDVMKKRGARLGGTTGQYALRFLGKDSFILSRSVIAALKLAGVITGVGTSKTDQRKIQEAFNAWHAENGETYTRMSRILAMSVEG